LVESVAKKGKISIPVVRRLFEKCGEGCRKIRFEFGQRLFYSVYSRWLRTGKTSKQNPEVNSEGERVAPLAFLQVTTWRNNQVNCRRVALLLSPEGNVALSRIKNQTHFGKKTFR
jgi:hypothetical protein